MDPIATTALVKSTARDIGFDRVGITRPGPAPTADYYRSFLQAGYAGTMDYLYRNADIRTAASELLPGAQAVICVALNYKRPQTASPPPATPPTGRVAQYARGRDYHAVLHRMLAELAARLHAAIATPFTTRACVDTAPVLERDLAFQAGLGWFGKNTMILHQDLGSYFFLGELFTTLPLVPDQPMSDHCGTCTRCLDACPTAAFPAPRVLDASRCISYLTIEHRDTIDPELAARMDDWVFGCDICQQVCPFNRKAPAGRQPELMADQLPERLDLLELVQLRSGDYKRLTRHSATRRASRPMWRRNAEIALANRRRAAE
jgi:epoxyqueuosine reductase